MKPDCSLKASFVRTEVRLTCGPLTTHSSMKRLARALWHPECLGAGISPRHVAGPRACRIARAGKHPHADLLLLQRPGRCAVDVARPARKIDSHPIPGGETANAVAKPTGPRLHPFEKLHIPLVKLSRTLPATPCLACHRSFFPLSYGLENFDLLGRWRSDYGPDPLPDSNDATGAMVDGTTFNGPVELRRALLERRDAFLNVMTERLLAYSIDGKTAMNKGTPASRMPAVRAALREAEDQNYSWSSLIAAIVKAPSDLHRPVETAAGQASLSGGGARR